MKIHQAASVISLALLATFAQAEEMNISDLPATRPVDTTPRLAFGQMIHYGGKTVFSPCRDRSFVYFDDGTSDGHVGKELEQLGLLAGKKLYVEVLGIREGDFLKATDINFLQVDGRCQMPGGKEESWRASGNEPGWVLAFGAEFVQVKRVGQPEVVVPAGKPTVTPELVTYTATQDKQTVALRFERKVCRDPAAQAVFGWTATVTVNGETLKGCAWER